jgi:uncharacterized protein YjbJ (UPF0337 family)
MASLMFDLPESGQRTGTVECSKHLTDEPNERSSMGADDKIENKAEELKGKVKEGAGKVTDDHSLEAEGHADQAKAGLKQAGEHVKDSFTKNDDDR